MLAMGRKPTWPHVEMSAKARRRNVEASLPSCTALVIATARPPVLCGQSMEDFRISLEDVALLSQVAGAIAVFASLIFVGLQIREQANATSAQTEQAIASNWMALAQVIGGNAEAFTAGLASTNATFADLNDADRMRFLSAMFALFKHYENMYLQFEKGRIDEAQWDPWSNHVKMYFHQPGVQMWWSLRESAFSLVFREFLDHSVPPSEFSPAALHVSAAKA